MCKKPPVFAAGGSNQKGEPQRMGMNVFNYLAYYKHPRQIINSLGGWNSQKQPLVLGYTVVSEPLEYLEVQLSPRY
jgi:hypothetical protein